MENPSFVTTYTNPLTRRDDVVVQPNSGVGDDPVGVAAHLQRQHRSFDPVPAKRVGPGRPSPHACFRQLADGLGAEPPHQIRPVAYVLVGRLQIREPKELQIDLSSLPSCQVNPVGTVVLFLGDLHRPSAWRDWGIEEPQLERREAEFQPTSPIGHLAHGHRR
jgi:hypothetical protein